MGPERFNQITSAYPKLRVGVLGDFCLDRYLEIDPERKEISIETGLPVHNVIQVRAQAGGAGTILNNLATLGIGEIYPIGFVGQDGEGYELWSALEKQRGVRLDGIIRTPYRRTFTYCKPLLMWKQKPPEELNRLDSKNWTATPAEVEAEIVARLQALQAKLHGLIVLDQVDLAGTGVVTSQVLSAIDEAGKQHSQLKILADSRRGLRDFPPVIFKMNAAELATFIGAKPPLGMEEIRQTASAVSRKNRREVFVSLAEQGLLAADPHGRIEHISSLPLRGPIDVVGAGDAVSANLVVALCGGADLGEAIELANAAGSIVIHKLGTTGTASVPELQSLILAK